MSPASSRPGTARLIALDIDGTLLAPGASANALPDPAITAAVRAHIAAGTTVVLATGRMFPGTIGIAEHLGIESPLICQQGASIHEHSGALAAQHCIDPGLARDIAGYAHANGWELAWFDAQRYLVTALHPAAEHFAQLSGVTAEIHSAPERSGIAPIGVDIISSATEALGIHDELADRYGERVQLIDFSTVTAAYHPVATKGASIAALAEARSIAPEEVVAIGDSANDASMLRWAGFGASPEHCDRYARGAADEILAGHGVSGVAQLLEDLL